MCKLKSCSIFLVIISIFLSGLASAEDIRIALRANKGSEKALEKWQATADYLSKEIPGYQFVLVPFESNGLLNQAISLGGFDFSITNPASGIEHKIRNDAQPLATLVNKRQGKGYSQFGSVIFTRADRHDVNSLQDLKGKTFTAADELGFGGWRIAWLELLNNDINPYTDFNELHFAGGKQQNVVYEVRDKRVAAGTVRTDMLERMAAEGEISLNDFKVLAQKKSKGFPFLHSTKLYPEWMFSSVGKTDGKLKADVIKALFSITKKSAAAKKGKYIGWIAPLDYSSVDILLQELKVGPYNIATLSPFKRLVSQYGMYLLIAVFAIAFLIFTTLYVLGLNKKILEAKDLLEKEFETSKNLEIQLLHSKRIESLGKLTGGIAHDFNNLLASILGYTELALENKKVKDDKDLTRYLSQVIESSEKSSRLVSQMLIFSRSESDNTNKEIILADDIMDNIKLLIRPLSSNNLILNINKSSQDLFVVATPVLITQALMNLYLNAKDSVEDKKGNIIISAKAVNFNTDSDVCNSCHQSIKGEYVEFSVADNGCGIKPENMKHLFEPFFTTKDVGKGTGMGLSVAHGIVHKHQGHILIDSTPGTGTIISFLLPRTNSQKKIENKDNALCENKHIVIVDDEISITTYLAEYLQILGYKISSFNDSQTALLYIQQTADNIDLVITDQSMPNINGFELAENIIERYNKMPIILCSDLTNGLEEKVKAKFNTVYYLMKPIKSDVLSKKIELLLKS